jgi:hypothetical protein
MDVVLAHLAVSQLGSDFIKVRFDEVFPVLGFHKTPPRTKRGTLGLRSVRPMSSTRVRQEHSSAATH